MRVLGAAWLVVLLAGCQWIGDIGTRELADDDHDASLGGTSSGGGAGVAGGGADGGGGAGGVSGSAGSDAATGGVTSYLSGNQYGGSGDEVVQSFDLTPDPGDLLLSGIFFDQLAFGGNTQTLQADLDGDFFVARFDATGKPIFSRRIEIDPADDLALALVTFDDANHAYVAGTAQGLIQTGGLSKTADLEGDIYLLALDVTGQATGLWTYPAALQQRVSHVSAGGGEIVMTGVFEGTLDFGGTATSVTANAGPQAFVAKLNSQGQGIWVRSFETCNGHYMNGVGRGPDGSVYVAGDFSGKCSLDTLDVSLDAALPHDCFVARLTTDGFVDRVFDVKANCYANEVVVAPPDVFLAGSLTGKSLSFDALDALDLDAFVVKLDTSLNDQWGRSLAHRGIDTVSSIDVGTLGDPFVGGLFADGTTVVRLASNSGLPVGSIAFGTKPALTKPAGALIRASQIGELWLAGSFYNPTDFGGGVLTPSGTSTTDIFLGKYLQ